MALKLPDPTGAQSGGFSPVAHDGTPYLWGSFNVSPSINTSDGKIFRSSDTTYWTDLNTSGFSRLGQTLDYDGAILVAGDGVQERVVVTRSGLDSAADDILTISSPLGTSGAGSYGGNEFGRVVAAADNLIAITCPGASRAYLYNQDGTQISSLIPPGLTNPYVSGIAIGEGIVAVGVNQFTFTVPASIHLFNYQGTFLKSISSTDYTITSSSGFALAQSLAIADGKIATGSREHPSITTTSTSRIHVFDFMGNEIHNISLSGGSGGLTSVGMGSGRIVAGRGLSSAFVYDYAGNLIKQISAPSGVQYFAADAIKIANGIIAIGNGSDSATAFASGTVALYDLDGNFIQLIEFPSGENSQSQFLGEGIAIGEGQIAVGGSQSYKFCTYPIEMKPNSFDVLRILRKKDGP